MKLVDSKTIAQAEVMFCSELSSSLDLASIGELFRERHNMRLSGPLQFQDLNVVVHNDQIAFKVDCTSLGYYSIYMDRSGAFLKMEEQGDQIEDKQEASDPDDTLVKAGIIRDKVTQMADTIARGIEKDTLVRLIEINSHAKLNGRLDFMGAQFAVHQNQPIYNLIYQGEIALQFLIDEKGRFLDFAETPEITDDGSEEKAESSITSHTTKVEAIDEYIVNEERDSTIGEKPNDAVAVELVDNEEVEIIDDEELVGLEELILDDLNDDNQDKAST